MLRLIYDRTLAAAAHRHAKSWLALVSFLESSVFPIPPDVMLVPMVLADRDRWVQIALVCTLASVAGGLAGYTIGLFLFDTVGQALMEFYGHSEEFAKYTAYYIEWGAWIVFGAGLTPFPYKVVTIASGVTNLDVVIFVIASALARGLRFFAVAAFLWRFGPAVRQILERYLGPITVLFFVLLIGGLAVLKYLV
ncbi:MAG: cytochrome B [Rhodospirillaceae bacterium]|nr:cytochrome B [Rhodospirillaceae bacterium]